MYSKNKYLPVVTYILLIIQITVFLLETVNGGSNNPLTLVNYGAKVNVAIVQGQWWRLITPMFVHIGFTHILINSITLYFAGIQLEELFGHVKFLAIYLVSGIMGNLLSFAFGDFSTITAGASTGLFGLFAVFIALGYLNKSNTNLRLLGNQFMTLIILNIIMDIFMNGVDILGHIGGALGGILITFVISKNFSENQNILLRIGSSLLLLILVVFLYSVGMGRV